MVEGEPAALEEEQGRPVEAIAAAAEALAVAAEDLSHRAVEELPQSRQAGLHLGEIGHDETGCRRRSRGSDVCCQVTERRVLLVTHGRDDGHGAGRERSHDGLVAEGQEILEAPAAPGDDDDVHRGVGCDPPECPGDAEPAPAPWTRVSATTRWARRVARADAREEIAPCRCIRSGDDPDRPWKPGEGALALGREQPLGGEEPFEALDRREVVAEPDSLDRARAEAESTLGGVDLRLSLDEHALALLPTRARGCRSFDAASWR